MSNFCFAQKEWSVFGRVINHEFKTPISSITITNTRSKSIVVSNREGDFYIRAADGDSLIASGVGFGKLGMKWKEGMKNIRFELNAEAIVLDEVIVTDKRSETLAKEIERFLKETPNAASIKRDIMGNIVGTNGLSNGGAGIGISIDALYELWSKEGKANRKAAELEYQDLKKFYVSLRYNKYKIGDLTGFKGQELTQFMDYCKLSDDFVLSATDYDLTYEIFKCKKNYRRSFFPTVED